MLQSELAGRCRGWDGATLFQLESGGVWRQCARRTRAFHALNPRVRIFHFRDRYFLEVEGAGELLPVMPVAGGHVHPGGTN